MFCRITAFVRTADIVKVFSLNAISTLVRMLAGMVSIKVVAAIIGPAGVALLGQLGNISSILLGVANGGIGSGVTKYVAEYKEDSFTIRKYLSNALRITLYCTFAIALVLIFGSSFLSKYILLSDEYGYVFVVFGFTIVFYSLNTLLISILNGYKRFQKYVTVNITGTITGLLFSISLVSLWGLTGALINAVTFQSVMFFVTLYLLRKEEWLRKELFMGGIEKKIVRDYLKFSSMTFISLALLPVSQMLLRGYVISQISIDDAGLWEGMNKISNMYLSVITTSLTVYYLPRLSEIRDRRELHCEIFRCYKFILPMLVSCLGLVYLLRHFILWLLFTPAFYPMEALFAWQLAGDFFKIASWLLSFQMVAKAQTKLFISTETAFTLLYVILSFAFMKTNGIVGLVQGYLVNYILYSLLMLWLYRDIVFIKKVTR